MNDKMKIDIAKIALALFENKHKEKRIVEAISKLYPDSTIDFIIENIIDMYSTLKFACHKAGGAAYSTNELSKITAIELITHLATNKIRFVFDPHDIVEKSRLKGDND